MSRPLRIEYPGVWYHVMNHIVLIKVKGRLDPILLLRRGYNLRFNRPFQGRNRRVDSYGSTQGCSYIKRFGLSELTDPVTRDISNKENSTEIN